MQTLQRARALGPTAIVAEVLAQWPQTIPVFVRHRMGCVGCSMARFETLADSACIYGLSISQFLDELRQTLPDMARRQNM
jgi:hybrid cluster-associated redox disulfide protein